MANPFYPLAENIHSNFEELFARLGIQPDDNGKAGNFDGEIVEITLLASTPTLIYHSLQREPVGFVVLYKSEFGDYKLSAFTDESLTIEADANMTLKGMIL